MDNKQIVKARHRALGLGLLGLATVAGLAIASHTNYLLFHTLAEGVSIIVAVTIAVLAWNTWEMTGHGTLKLMGIAFLFIGALDWIHTMAYKGIGIFPGYDANLPTQLWIVARYLQAITLLIAPTFLHRDIDRTGRKLLTGAYALITTLLLVLIFTGRFPDCYVAGQGLTPFKIVSEYLIILMLIAGAWRFARHRDAFSPTTFRWIAIAIGATILSEFAFTRYVSVYGLSNVVGHMLKIVTFFGFYQAIVETGLRRPYALLFRDLRRRNEQLDREIAERKQVEADLRYQRDRAQHYLDVAGVMLVAINPQQQVTLINPKGCEILGYPETEVVGRNWFETFIPPDSVDDVKRVFNRVIVEDFEPVEYYENAIVRKDGSRRFIAWHNSVLRNQAGEITGIFSSGTDITERKRAEERLRESRNRFRALTETSPVGITVVDREGRITFANRRAETILGLTRDQIAQRTYNAPQWQITDVEGGPFPEEALPFRRVMETGQAVYDVQHAIVKSDHQRIVLNINAAPLFDESGRIQDIVSTLEDITESRRLEAQLRRQEQLAAVGQLASGIAHDFRNILASIILYAQMDQRRSDLPPDVQQHLAVIVEESDRATDLIQQILDFSSHAMIQRAPVDLAALVTDLVDRILQRTIPETIDLEVTVAPGAGPDPLIIRADPGRIQQALTNLALNARDAMPDGGTIHFTVAPAEGHFVRLTVADTGTGMTERVRAHLFEPFFTTKAPDKGTGLGLAQVYGIVRQHDGYIDVETEPDEGATFHLYLPRTDPRPPQPEAAHEPGIPRGRGETILVVEDSTRIRDAVVEGLGSLGYRVLTAANGRDALETASASNVDLVLTDLVMPAMGGHDLLRALRNRIPDLRAVAMTGYASALDDHTRQDGGFDGVITKPFSIEELAATVRGTLEGPPPDRPRPDRTRPS